MTTEGPRAAEDSMENDDPANLIKEKLTLYQFQYNCVLLCLIRFINFRLTLQMELLSESIVSVTINLPSSNYRKRIFYISVLQKITMIQNDTTHPDENDRR